MNFSIIENTLMGEPPRQPAQRLELFEIIEKTAELLESNRPLYEKAASEIIALLAPLLQEENRQIVGLKSRVKSKNSLKEKIIRRELYKQFTDPKRILVSISDVLGILAECRFTSDEVKVYTRLKENFFLMTEDGLFYDPAIPNLYLWLNIPQPQMQKNGYEVFRVDGIYVKDAKQIRFELQIKSMVNSFWSEIEHEIIYKNNYYLPDNEFIRSTLDTLKTNLDGIDNMLMLLASRLAPKNEDHHMFTDLGYGNFIAMLISDLYMKKMADSLGFTIDFRKTCQVLGFYIARKNVDTSPEEMRNIFFRLSNKFIAVRENKTNFEEQILFEREFCACNLFSQILGKKMQELANSDYEWHVFFKMLFEMEAGNCIEDLELFVNVLYKAYSNQTLYEPIYRRLAPETADQIREEILTFTAEILAEDGKIQILYQEYLSKMMDAIQWVAAYIGEDGRNVHQLQERREEFREQFMAMLR
jgi:ppGpp synthetase/RelA/SpoT-type nucleotidyltranferase